MGCKKEGEFGFQEYIRYDRAYSIFTLLKKNLLDQMKYLLIVLCAASMFTSFSQERVNPVIKNYGGIYEVPEATVTPDSAQDYNIVIDVYGGAKDKKEIDRSLNNVARMLNLHAVGGVSPEKLNVVLALHGQSTYSALDNATYQKEFGVSNPNAGLLKELKEVGVLITVCGQSLRGRGFGGDELNDEVEVATSMLTTVTYYQSLGYIMLKF